MCETGGGYEQAQDFTLDMERKMTNFKSRKHFLYHMSNTVEFVTDITYNATRFLL